jgi:hypothetical protein
MILTDHLENCDGEKIVEKRNSEVSKMGSSYNEPAHKFLVHSQKIPS